MVEISNEQYKPVKVNGQKLYMEGDFNKYENSFKLNTIG